jgi:uncharacterized membrane protein
MSTMKLYALQTGPVNLSNKKDRVESIDLLRGVVMIIMALDHTRDYFQYDAFVYSPTDLSQTSVFLFFTRWITHFCAPVFVFLAGISAYLYGAKRTRKELSFFLFTRGLFLVILEATVLALERTFNPSFSFINLQVIFAIGVSMMVLSVLIYLRRNIILIIGLLIIAGHNLLDNVHVPGKGLSSFGWAIVHDHGNFTFGKITFSVHYSVLAWIGIMTTGYGLGNLFTSRYDQRKRRKILLSIGWGAIALFILLRAINVYGDPAHWSVQKNAVFSFLSFINVTKYPPSLLYVLILLGPAMIFLALTEKPLNALTQKISLFGRVAMFYYLAHILLIHLLALFGAVISGHLWSDMVLTSRVNDSPGLKGYGFNLFVVYIVWIAVVLILYTFCKRFDSYKRGNVGKYGWLSYL